MLTIRFSRIGKKKKAFYKIIISEKKKDTQAHYLELLGHYNPHTKEVVIKADRVKHWINLGATLSGSVFNLLTEKNVIESGAKRRSVFLTKKRKVAIAEKAAKTAEALPETAPLDPASSGSSTANEKEAPTGDGSGT